MVAVALTKYNAYIDEVAVGGHNHKTDVFKFALTNTAPGAGDTVWSAAVYPPPAAANGYTGGGSTLTNTSGPAVGGLFKLILSDTVFTATAGGIGPFRYGILYNSSKSNKLIGYYDYGSSVTLADTDTFTTDFDAVNGVLTIQ